MKQYYLDTSVLVVYTLASGTEIERYPAVQQLFKLIEDGRLKSSTSFYALHELYLFALENAPDFEIGTDYGKEALNMILSTRRVGDRPIPHKHKTQRRCAPKCPPG